MAGKSGGPDPTAPLFILKHTILMIIKYTFIDSSLLLELQPEQECGNKLTLRFFKVGRPAALKIDDVMSEIYQKSLKLKGSVSHKVKLILKKIRLNLN